MKHVFKLLNISFWCTLVLVLTVGNANAGTINCGSAQRTMEFTNVDGCAFGLGNIGGSPADLTLIATYFPPGPYTLAGSRDTAGTNGPLTIGLTSGSFGSGDAAGTWAIDSSFWVTYGVGVITSHVGQGGGDPDHWAFLITPNSTSGGWVYDLISGTGGGLSNFKLFGSGRGTTQVPEPGILSLLGLCLLGLGLSSRRRLKVQSI